MTLSSDAVSAAFDRWIWYPDDAAVVETDEYLLVRFPDWFLDPLQLLRLRPGPGRGPDAVLDEVVARAGELGGASLLAWVRLDAPDGLETALVARGGLREETVDAFALDLAGGVPDLDPAPRAGLRWMTDLMTARDEHRVEVEVFGGRMPPEERLVQAAEAEGRDHAEGRGGRLVAYLDGEAVGCGGVALAGGDARLWGGAVVARARGRGVYRALLRERLAYAVEHGATMALVKGRIETSGPILRRAGFEVFGQERSYRLPLQPQE